MQQVDLYTKVDVAYEASVERWGSSEGTKTRAAELGRPSSGRKCQLEEAASLQEARERRQPATTATGRNPSTSPTARSTRCSSVATATFPLQEALYSTGAWGELGVSESENLFCPQGKLRRQGSEAYVWHQRFLRCSKKISNGGFEHDAIHAHYDLSPTIFLVAELMPGINIHAVRHLVRF